MAELQGGKFGHGFISAGIVKAFTPGIEKIKSIRLRNGKSLGQAIAAGVLGGTVSAMTGGKFANGAITGMFQNLYNAQGNQGGQDLKVKMRKNNITASSGDVKGKVTFDENGRIKGVNLQIEDMSLSENGFVFSPSVGPVGVTQGLTTGGFAMG